MVDRLKLGFKVTGRCVEQVYDMVVVGGTIAAVVKLAIQPHVHTAVASLPLWQLVAGVLLAGIVVREYKLRSKE